MTVPVYSLKCPSCARALLARSGMKPSKCPGCTRTLCLIEMPFDNVRFEMKRRTPMHRTHDDDGMPIDRDENGDDIHE